MRSAVVLHGELHRQLAAVGRLDHQARELVDRDAQVFDLLDVEAEATRHAGRREAHDPDVLQRGRDRQPDRFSGHRGFHSDVHLQAHPSRSARAGRRDTRRYPFAACEKRVEATGPAGTRNVGRDGSLVTSRIASPWTPTRPSDRTGRIMEPGNTSRSFPAPGAACILSAAGSATGCATFFLNQVRVSNSSSSDPSSLPRQCAAHGNHADLVVTVAAWTEGPAVVIEVRWRHGAEPESSPAGIQGAEASRALAVVAAVVEVLRIRGRDGVLRAEKQTAPSGERFRALSRG